MKNSWRYSIEHNLKCFLYLFYVQMMLQSVLRKMCVFMWILTLSLNYIRSRNVDEAKFVFLWCLFKKYIPAGKTSSRSAAAFSIWTVFYFLLLPCGDTCTAHFYCCYDDDDDDVVVVLHHLLFMHHTSHLLTFTFSTKPTQTLLGGNVLIFQSDCVIVWSSFVLKECNTETTVIFQRDIPAWYSRVIFQGDISWIQTEGEDVCWALWEIFLQSSVFPRIQSSTEQTLSPTTK